MGNKSNFPQIMRQAGFKLRQYRDGPLDWRLMGAYETDRILREQNFELVDDALQHLSEAPLGTALDTHILDSGIAKYFTMSQYAIQYLLCCRTFLDESVVELREAHATAQHEIAKLRKSLAESNNEIIQLHKKITQIEAIREVVFPCHLCPKNFISNEALNIHIGRKHRVGTPTHTTTPAGGGSVSRDRDNDMQLINTIKMELEIKQLKERLNAAEKNIKERNGSCAQPVALSPRQDQATATIDVRNVGIQSNPAEAETETETKEKDELSNDSERKAQLQGLAERLSSFEAWQTQLKQGNEQFIQDINQKLEDLKNALEMSKQREQPNQANAPTEREAVVTPCLDDLERILADKVAEIGKVSGNKLEEVVNQLEISYNGKLEALERELKRLSETTKDVERVQQSTSSSKIPKPVPKKNCTNLELIKQRVESEFLKTKPDDDTYSIEEPPIHLPDQKPKQSTNQVQELPSRSSSGSHPTFNKPPNKFITLESPKEKAPDATDVSESLSEEEVQSLASEQSSEPTSSVSSEPERQVFKEPKPKVASKAKSPQKPMTRADARKLVNLKLRSHGLNMKSKSVSNASFKRIQLNDNAKDIPPRFYATRNRIRKFVDKLCSAKLLKNTQLLLNSPIQSTGVSTGESMNEEEETGVAPAKHTSESQSEEDATSLRDESHSSSSIEQQQKHSNFKAQLEEMLAKPAARLASRPNATMVQMQAAKPVPMPRKRVIFNTLASVIDGDAKELK